MSASIRDQIGVRHRYLDDVIAYFRARPGIWIEAAELARVGGFCGWRTRVSDARKVFETEGGSLEWNRHARGSAYRYLRHVPLGRSAETITEGQGTLFQR